MNEFERISKDVKRMFNGMGWIRWIHSGTTPAETNAGKVANAAIGAISSHCARCLNLNGCCFPENNMPPQPLHPNCHCKKELVASVVAKCRCILGKFTDYIFDDDKNGGKKDV